ncbi:hypothetical protein LGM90_23465 [Burkholderia sp. AU28942]|uniref:hypothetical protein n=1 Tax=Burkholderia TaxID=32008 RepID=UPI001CF4CF34|nr:MULTISPECIES: hypothetical protein [Burkholderia]MCA8311473.1 hypothetical protein [Burkholderia sp. AU28942]
MSSKPPRCGRRPVPLDYRFEYLKSREPPRPPPFAVTRPGLVDSTHMAAGGMRMHATGAAHGRFARLNDDPEIMLAHLRARAVPPRRPAGIGRLHASRTHAVVRNTPAWFGWN